MNKIPTPLKGQPVSTQARETEKSSYATFFSRRKDSGIKLLLSLKNFFSRTGKSSASATVTKAVPQATIRPVKTEQKKHVTFKLENQKIPIPVASKFTEISNKTTEKKSNQLENISNKLPEQLDFEKFFKNNFNDNLKLALNKTFDSNLFNKNVISAANTVLTIQMNDDSQMPKKESILKAIESKLKMQFGNSIESETMDGIMNAVSSSLDFAEAQELKRMRDLEPVPLGR